MAECRTQSSSSSGDSETDSDKMGVKKYIVLSSFNDFYQYQLGAKFEQVMSSSVPVLDMCVPMYYTASH